MLQPQSKPQSQTNSKYKTNFEKPFDSFISSRYAEHASRIASIRKTARRVLFLYPLGFVLFVGIPVGAVALSVGVLYESYPKWFSQFIPQETGAVVMPTLYWASGLLTFLALVLGIGTGIGKSKQLIFDAERFELDVRQVYTMNKLVRYLKKQQGSAN